MQHRLYRQDEKVLKIQNDSKTDEDLLTSSWAAYSCMFEAMKDDAGIYVFHADTEDANFSRALTDSGLRLSWCCV